MNRLLEKIDQIGEKLSADEIDVAIAILAQKKQPIEQRAIPGSTDEKTSSTWIEIKKIKGHPYQYKRWREPRPKNIPGKSKNINRSKYIGKA